MDDDGLPWTDEGKELLDQLVPSGNPHERDCPDCRAAIARERADMAKLIVAIEKHAFSTGMALGEAGTD